MKNAEKKYITVLILFLSLNSFLHAQTAVDCVTTTETCGNTTNVTTTVYIENSANSYSTYKYREYLGFYCTDLAYKRIIAHRNCIYSMYKSEAKRVAEFMKYLKKTKNSLNNYKEVQPKRHSWTY
jgi:predicted transcriptional regulator of viral defense system